MNKAKIYFKEKKKQIIYATFCTFAKEFLSKSFKMKVIENKILPPKGFVAINLFTIILTRNKKELTKELLNHERIHSRQMLEMMFLFAYLWYLIEFVFRLIQYRNWQKAYRNLSFEKEAYKNQNNPSYLKERKPFAWVKYL